MTRGRDGSLAGENPPSAHSNLFRSNRNSLGSASVANARESIMTPYVLTASVAALMAFIPSSSKAQPPRLGADKPILLAQGGPPPLPQPAAAQFYYSENGKPVGPVTLAEIQAKIAAGTITPDTLV